MAMASQWWSDGMRTTIDRTGRLVVPKALRDRLGLNAGAGVELTERGAELVITPVGPEIVLEQREGRRVFVTTQDETPGLTDDDVRRMVEESRQWPRG